MNMRSWWSSGANRSLPVRQVMRNTEAPKRSRDRWPRAKALLVPMAAAVLTATQSIHAQGPHTQTPAGRYSGHADMSPALQALQRDTGLNPAWLWIEQGRSLWSVNGPTGPSCLSCHGPLERMNRTAATHPRWHSATRRPRTLEDQVQACRQTRQGHTTANALSTAAGSVDVLALSAALVAAGQGVPIQPDTHPAMDAWHAQGSRLWHQRMGQLHLSCAQCHDQRAGQRLGGTRIPQAHDTGYPVYRMEWQEVGSLERRLRGCMSGIRAEPFALGADEWRALTVYMHRRSAGLPLEAGALRP